MQAKKLVREDQEAMDIKRLMPKPMQIGGKHIN